MAVQATGRPITKKGPAAARHRVSAQKWYASLSPAEKIAYVRRRSRAAQNAAEKRRYSKHHAQRNAYHRDLTSKEHAAEAQGKLKRPKTCAYPGCTRTDVQFHHTGTNPTRGRWLCAKHNDAQHAKKPGR